MKANTPGRDDVLISLGSTDAFLGKKDGEQVLINQSTIIRRKRHVLPTSQFYQDMLMGLYFLSEIPGSSIITIMVIA